MGEKKARHPSPSMTLSPPLTLLPSMTPLFIHSRICPFNVPKCPIPFRLHTPFLPQQCRTSLQSPMTHPSSPVSSILSPNSSQIVNLHLHPPTTTLLIQLQSPRNTPKVMKYAQCSLSFPVPLSTKSFWAPSPWPTSALFNDQSSSFEIQPPSVAFKLEENGQFVATDGRPHQKGAEGTQFPLCSSPMHLPIPRNPIIPHLL